MDEKEILKKALYDKYDKAFGQTPKRTKLLIALLSLFFIVMHMLFTNDALTPPISKKPLSLQMWLVKHNPKTLLFPKPFSIPNFKEQSSLKPRKVPGVSCLALIAGNEEQLDRVKSYHSPNRISAIELTELASNCSHFRSERGYLLKPQSPEEANFRLAFSILAYKDADQIERLLRAIYAPQNFYCIHPDQKTNKDTLKAILAVANCFPNVVIPTHRESVFWGHISILHAEMSCLKELLKFPWKYFLNLSGQMFPLQTNRQLVQILKLYNGANDIEGSYKRNQVSWLLLRQMVSWRYMSWLDIMLPSIYPKGSAPFNVTVYKGSNQAAITRAFAVYLMHSHHSIKLMDWFKDTLAPDEYVWPTLNHNAHLHAPGGFLGDPENKKFTARATIWLPISNQKHWSWDYWACRGKWVREICVFGIGDLPWLAARPELFANKFFPDFEPLAYDCLEQLNFNRTLEKANAMEDYYKGIPFVNNRSTITTLEDSMTSKSL